MKQYELACINDRIKLRDIVNQNIPIPLLINSHQLIQSANQHSMMRDIGLIGGAFIAKSSARIIDIKKQRINEFLTHIEQVKNKLHDLATAKDKAKRIAARTAYKKAHIHLNKVFSREVKQFDLHQDIHYRKYWKALRNVWKHGLGILDTTEAKAVAAMSQDLHYVSHGLWILDIGIAVGSVITAYREGKHWLNDAITDSIDIASGYLIGVLGDALVAAIALTPGGWIAIIVTGCIEAAAGLITAYLINRGVRRG